MKEQKEDEIEVEIREHSDADFLPEKCPHCKERNLKKLTYKRRELQDLETPLICHRIHYERVYFECKECGEVFTIEHPLIPINARYMPGVIKYAIVRVLRKGDSIRRVTQDLNELHLVNVSETTVNFMTIDFSARLEAGVKQVFPDVILQKCVFHAIQLLTRGLIKEFTKIKKEHLLDHIEEWKILRRYTLSLEKNEKTAEIPPFKFNDMELARQIYLRLRSCVSHKNPRQIEQELYSFFSTSIFDNWKAKQVFMSKYNDIFITEKFKYTMKGMKYIVPKIYKAFRAAIRGLRKNLEKSKSHFNKIKYLVLRNPINMEPYHRRKLRKYLKEFPWLRSYRQLIVKFYHQFRLPAEKRVPLSFLSKLITNASHSWLKSAFQTLIENEENVFRFQHIPKLFPKIKPSKSLKVVNESCNKLANQMHQTQCGMRTLENTRMRISNRLNCPIIISPTLLEKIK